MSGKRTPENSISLNRFEDPRDFGRWSRLGTADGDSVMLNSSHTYPLTVEDYIAQVKNLNDGEEVVPLWLELRPTNLCNQDCVMCGTRASRKIKTASLSCSRALEVLRDARELGIKEVRFCGGGEPLLYPDIEILVQSAHKLGLGVMFITNGELLDERRCEAIAPYCHYIRLSINGGRSGYQLVHRTLSRSFFTVTANARRLAEFRRSQGLEQRLYLAATYVVMPGNHHEIYDTAKLLKEAGLDAVYFRGATVLPEFTGTEHCRIRQEEERCRKLADGTFFTHFAGRLFDPAANPPVNHGYCYQSQLRLYIEADGNASICGKWAETSSYSLGNINRQPLCEILDSAVRKECRRTAEMHCTGCDSAYFNEAMDFVRRKVSAGENRFLRLFDAPLESVSVSRNLLKGVG